MQIKQYLILRSLVKKYRKDIVMYTVKLNHKNLIKLLFFIFNLL
ncbi:hypothetical protein [Spiroplasma endosymbiont of Polydrusus cervinus]